MYSRRCKGLPTSLEIALSMICATTLEITLSIICKGHPTSLEIALSIILEALILEANISPKYNDASAPGYSRIGTPPHTYSICQMKFCGGKKSNSVTELDTNGLIS